jgi:hypothetical protein
MVRDVDMRHYDRYLGAYYRRRVRQGLTKKRAVLSAARKLVRISHALLKSDQPYQPQVVGGK